MSEIYNIVDKKKLDVVKKPISKAHGLPNECYTSKEYTLIERKKLFEDKWTAIGCLLYTSPSPRDLSTSRMPSSA